MQAHLRADMFQRLHLEVGRPQPGFDRAKRVFDRFAAGSHSFWFTIQSRLHCIHHRFVLPATHASVLAGGAFGFDRTRLAR